MSPHNNSSESDFIATRVTSEMYENILHLSQIEDRSVSEWLRNLITQEIIRKSMTPKILDP
jgi:hypothetical protein